MCGLSKDKDQGKVDLGFHSFTSGTGLTQVLLGTSGLLLYAVPGQGGVH